MGWRDSRRAIVAVARRQQRLRRSRPRGRRLALPDRHALQAASGADADDVRWHPATPTCSRSSTACRRSSTTSARSSLQLAMKDTLTSPTTEQLHHRQPVSRALYPRRRPQHAGRRRAVRIRRRADGDDRRRADQRSASSSCATSPRSEAPLQALARNFAVIISTIAEITFYGHDQTGREASVTGQIARQFGNFGDPDERSRTLGDARSATSRQAKHMTSSEAPPQDHMTRDTSHARNGRGRSGCAGACTMKSQEAPPLTGPSELGQSIAVAVSPDVLLRTARRRAWSR